MDNLELKNLIQTEIKNYIDGYSTRNLFNPSKIPDHGHTGVDARQIDYVDLINKPSIANLQTIQGVATGAGSSQVITTGFTPKYISINAFTQSGGNHTMSWGTATTITDSQCQVLYSDGVNVYENMFNSSSIVHLKDTTGTDIRVGSISAIDATSFTITWSVTTRSCTMSWSAIG